MPLCSMFKVRLCGVVSSCLAAQLRALCCVLASGTAMLGECGEGVGVQRWFPCLCAHKAFSPPAC